MQHRRGLYPLFTKACDWTILGVVVVDETNVGGVAGLGVVKEGGGDVGTCADSHATANWSLIGNLNHMTLHVIHVQIICRKVCFYSASMLTPLTQFFGYYDV